MVEFANNLSLEAGIGHVFGLKVPQRFSATQKTNKEDVYAELDVPMEGVYFAPMIRLLTANWDLLKHKNFRLGVRGDMLLTLLEGSPDVRFGGNAGLSASYEFLESIRLHFGAMYSGHRVWLDDEVGTDYEENGVAASAGVKLFVGGDDLFVNFEYMFNALNRSIDGKWGYSHIATFSMGCEFGG